jgi:hypothetical protein
MFKLFKPPQLKVNGSDDGNSSSSDSFDQANGQSPFNSVDQFDTLSDTLGWGPWSFGAAGGDFAPPSAFVSGDWSSPSSSATSSSGTSTIVSTSGSGLVFDNTYDSSCTAAFEACIVAAEEQLESLFTNSDTIVVTFYESNEGNNHVALGNSSHGILTNYSTLRSKLLAAAPGDVLPTTDPSGGAQWYVPYAYARMLGMSGTTGSPDLSVTLNSYYNWQFGQDVINGLTHELSEGGMGRIGGLGGSGTGKWDTMDLFRYNASGNPDYSNGRDGDTTYFSNDGGATLSNQNNPAPSTMPALLASPRAPAAAAKCFSLPQRHVGPSDPGRRRHGRSRATRQPRPK